MSSDSEDGEFFDAVDDNERGREMSPQTPGPVPTRSMALTPVPIRSGSKLQEISWTDLSTGSTGVYKSDPVPTRSPPYPSLRLRHTVVKTHHKEIAEFEGLGLVQELKVSSQALWVAKFSPDGQFLAVAGEESVLRLYQISDTSNFSEGFFLPAPFQVYREHSKSILDVAWTLSSRYLLTAGMDKLVILWEVESPLPIRRFEHPDIVSSVDFNPHVRHRQNANYFSTGCFDCIVRVWNAAANRVDAYYQARDLITAVKYAPSAEYLCVGLKQGQVLTYASSLLDARLKFVQELSCRNRRGRKARGRRVTGVAFFDNSTFLVSTNDSRLRLYTDSVLKQKYKGHKAEKGPLQATFSHNLVHVISGSETGQVYIWNSYNTFVPSQKRRKDTVKNDSYESFLGSARTGAGTYVAIFAPQKTLRRFQERSLCETAIVSHIVVTGGVEGVLRVYYNSHPKIETR